MPPASVYSPLGQEDASEGVGPNKGGLSEQEKAGWFSKLFFGWISPLLAKGFSKKLEMEDVPVNSTGSCTGRIVGVEVNAFKYTHA